MTCGAVCPGMPVTAVVTRLAYMSPCTANSIEADLRRTRSSKLRMGSRVLKKAGSTIVNKQNVTALFIFRHSVNTHAENAPLP